MESRNQCKSELCQRQDPVTSLKHFRTKTGTICPETDTLYTTYTLGVQDCVAYSKSPISVLAITPNCDFQVHFLCFHLDMKATIPLGKIYEV